MRITWPIGITALLVIFMTGTLLMVYIAVNQDFSLVSKAYYEESLDYDQVMEKHENRIRDHTDIDFLVSVDQRSISLTFNNSENIPSGIISFYNPSEPNLDFTVDIKPNNGVQVVDLSQKNRGLWKIKVDWEQNNTAYIQEMSVKLN